MKTDFAIVSGDLRGGQLNVGSRQVEFDGAHVVDVGLSGTAFESFKGPRVDLRAL